MNQNDGIIVSICCITYNHAQYVRKCLDGFLRQECNFRYEILIHDDCSTDGTDAVIREYEVKYPSKIFPLYETENMYQKGYAGKMNDTFNIPRARGKYIALCEGDDYWTDPLKLQKQVDFMEAHPDYSMCYTDYQTVDAQGECIDWHNHPMNLARSFTGDNFRELVKGNYIQTMTMLYRTEVIKNPDYQSGIDYALSLVCALMGKCAFIPDKTACYRLHNASATHTAMEYVGAASLKAWEYYVELYLSKAQYRRSAWEYLLICGTIDACLISKNRSGGVQAEQADRVLKHHPELKKYMWLGVMYRLHHTIVKRLK